MYKEYNGYAIIYMFTSPSGKSYIGQTINFYKRFSNYKSLCKKSIGKHFYNALIKHKGIENFKLTILCKFELFENFKEVKSKLDELEINYIEKYNTVVEGYNLSTGGKSNYNREVSEETKKKISNNCKGIIKAERIEITCEHCHKSFFLLPGNLKQRLNSNKNKKLYCSLECARKSYKR